eukprot:5836515-Lingulodinium_polyedra.AAC.1
MSFELEAAGYLRLRHAACCGDTYDGIARLVVWKEGRKVGVGTEAARCAEAGSEASWLQTGR